MNRTALLVNNESARIPLTLQSIFLKGNRGIVVNAPPPGNVAMKKFHGWRWSGDNSKAKRSVMAELTTDDGPIMNCEARDKKTRKKRAATPNLSPQQYLDAMLMSRGYSPDIHSTLLTAYYNTPSKLQLASYGTYVTDLVRYGRVEELSETFVLGLSPNACNAHGESIVHTACRLSDLQTLDALIKAGCNVQVSNDNGRTPFHDACSSAEPNFRLIETLLNIDKNLFFLADKRGHLPLSCVKSDHWSLWLQFLESKKNDYWPLRRGTDGATGNSPDLMISMPHSRPVRDPVHALSIHISRMVAAGILKPSETEELLDFDDSGDTADLYSSDDEDDDDDDEENIENRSPTFNMSLHDTRYHDSSDLAEMKHILESIYSANQRPLDW